MVNSLLDDGTMVSLYVRGDRLCYLYVNQFRVCKIIWLTVEVMIE